MIVVPIESAPHPVGGCDRHSGTALAVEVMQMRGTLRLTALAAIGALALLHACSGSATGPSAAADDLVRSNVPPAPTPPPTPNPDEAAGMVTRFYRDLDAGTKSAYADVTALVTPDFMREHRDDLDVDYSFISAPQVQVRSVNGRTVAYSVDYLYKSQEGELHWERSGSWLLNHGRAGWLLDRDTWDSVRLIGLRFGQSPQVFPVTDHAFSDGHHEFGFAGMTVRFDADNKRWGLKVISTPAPSPPPAFAPSGDDGPSAPNQVSQAPAASSDASCEDVDVDGVYDDGAIIELMDGRRLRVSDVDTVTSSVWVAPFDGLVCDGDHLINKDDNESVNLEP
jgi:hypothetical protein